MRSRLMMIAVFLMILASRAQAGGLVLEQSMEISGLPGQPAAATTQKIWLTADRMRMEIKGGAGMPGMGNMTTILRSDLDKIFMIDDTRRSYMELPMDQSAGMPGLPAGLDIKYDLQASGRQKKIRDWDCREYILTISGGPVSSRAVLWVTDDIKFEQEFRDNMIAMTARNPMMQGLADKMREIKGFPVEQTMEMDMGGMRMTTVIRLNSATRQKIEADVFEPPADYTKTSMPM